MPRGGDEAGNTPKQDFVSSGKNSCSATFRHSRIFNNYLAVPATPALIIRDLGTLPF